MLSCRAKWGPERCHRKIYAMRCGQNMVMLGSTDTAEYAGSTSGSKDARTSGALYSRQLR